ncbi:MAG: FtsX-like permease family protein [Paraclostridium sp.]
MYYKIALKNVKKSFKDYTIYFLTLTLAVCIFYSFNSIGAQKALKEISTSREYYVNALINVISYVSVFVAIILGSLILYANNFLIKKRNKELGTYMILGMAKSKISKILIYETAIVGLISLLSGLILGIIISQGLSILVYKLFEFNMKEYQFIISLSAIAKTIIYFGIIFLIVMMFNTYIMSKYKVIDLLTYGRKNEEIKFKNPFVYLFSFALCVVCLVFAYKFILEAGLEIKDKRIFMSIILGVIGTILFFFSLTGFILYIAKNNKKIYFKNLNIFTINQINSKVNTNFISMSIICLMLFLTMCILTSGLGFKTSLEAGLKVATPFDASAYIYVYKDDKIKSIEESFENMGFEFNNKDKVVYYNKYTDDNYVADILGLKNLPNEINNKVSYIKISDYNKIMKMNNKETIRLRDNEVLISSNFDKSLPIIENYMKENKTLKIDNNHYTIKNKKIIKDNLETSIIQTNLFTVIINDEFCNNLLLSSSNVNVNFDENTKKESEVKFEKFIQSYKESEIDYNKTGFINGTTRKQVHEENKGMTTIILFIGIYLGIVFLISSMAMLALQQLTEASDSIKRYIAIKKIGANKNDINKTIFIQTLVYFSIPVSLALLHSVVGIKVANGFIAMYNKPNIGGSIFISGSIFILIYAIYFYTTYTGYKNIVKSKI